MVSTGDEPDEAVQESAKDAFQDAFEFAHSFGKWLVTIGFRGSARRGNTPESTAVNRPMTAPTYNRPEAHRPGERHTCPHCLRRLRTTPKGVMVRHGWEESGRQLGAHGLGEQTAPCPGTGKVPVEVSDAPALTFAAGFDAEAEQAEELAHERPPLRQRLGWPLLATEEELELYEDVHAARALGVVFDTTGSRRSAFQRHVHAIVSDGFQGLDRAGGPWIASYEALHDARRAELQARADRRREMAKATRERCAQERGLAPPETGPALVTILPLEVGRPFLADRPGVCALSGEEYSRHATIRFFGEGFALSSWVSALLFTKDAADPTKMVSQFVRVRDPEAMLAAINPGQEVTLVNRQRDMTTWRRLPDGQFSGTRGRKRTPGQMLAALRTSAFARVIQEQR